MGAWRGRRRRLLIVLHEQEGGGERSECCMNAFHVSGTIFPESRWIPWYVASVLFLPNTPSTLLSPVPDPSKTDPSDFNTKIILTTTKSDFQLAVITNTNGSMKTSLLISEPQLLLPQRSFIVGFSSLFSCPIHKSSVLAHCLSSHSVLFGCRGQLLSVKS